MIRVTGRFASAALETAEHKTSVILDVYGEHGEEFDRLLETDIDIEIRRHRDKRSTRANALCWELCSLIGRAITPPISKEDVYRKAIRDVGVFAQLSMTEKAWPVFEAQWRTNGVGWFAELIDHSRFLGQVTANAYYGSSTYDTKAMSILIDYLVDEARQMELPIGYDLEEIEDIKNSWAGDAQAK